METRKGAAPPRPGSQGVRTERGHVRGPVARAHNDLERTALMQDGPEARATRTAKEQADTLTRARETHLLVLCLDGSCCPEEHG